jgi:acetylornithine/succinyldiaminopimelate/putrescine aminotransferase
MRVDPLLGTAAQFVAELKTQGVLALAISPQQVRLVTHLDVTEAQCRRASEAILHTAQRLTRGQRTPAALEPAY